MAVVIAGFSSADKVPGAYGEVVYGAGGQSAASIPLAVLLVGLQTGSNLTADTQVQAIYSLADIDYYCGAGSELACMAYDALVVNQASTISVASPTAAGGAVAATVTLTIAGTPALAGYVTVRIAGIPISFSFTTVDTATTIAAGLCSQINGYNVGRLPISAANVAGVITLTCKTAGIRGNLHAVFVDTTGLRSTTVTATLSAGTAITGGGMTMTTGAGTEVYTNLLLTLAPRTFDRIGLAANDSVSLGAWNTQVTTNQSTPTVGILQHVVFATNGTLAACESLAGTTCNSQRFQALWQLNSETHPSRMAACFASLRALTEQNDPAAMYDGVALTTVVPQSQQGDWPTHTTLVAALNNGVTPIITSGDGVARICRSITTHCLNGANPDYSTLDTAQAVVPDFIVRDLKIYWTTVFANPVTGNVRVQPDPGPNDPLPAAGVAYPTLWASKVTDRLRLYEAGKLPGTCPPIITGVSQNLPEAEWNPVAKRIMSAVPSNTAAGNHQVGISVRQVG